MAWMLGCDAHGADTLSPHLHKSKEPAEEGDRKVAS